MPRANGKWRKTGRSGIVAAMQQSAPIAQDLVLVGGGHAHVHVLKRFGMRPAPGVRLTLITRDIETPYSGMLPGYVAGLYSFAECHIDLLRLARFAGARLIHDEAVGLDRARRQVLCRTHPPIRYDLLSLDIGSPPPVGGGAGGVELALSAQHRLAELLKAPPEVTLVTREGLLPSHNKRVRQRFARLLAERGIRVVANNPIVRVEP